MNNDNESNPPSRHEFLTKITAFLQSEFDAEMVIDGAYFIGKNAYKAGKLLKKTVGNVKKVAKKNET